MESAPRLKVIQSYDLPLDPDAPAPPRAQPQGAIGAAPGELHNDLPQNGLPNELPAQVPVQLPAQSLMVGAAPSPEPSAVPVGSVLGLDATRSLNTNVASMISANSPANLQCEKFMQYPAGYRTVRLFTDTEVAQTFNQVIHHPYLLHLLGVEAVLFVALIVVRLWRLSLAKTWLSKAWLKFWTLIIYLIFAGLVVPTVVLWKDYYNLLRLFFDILRGNQ